jgi:hypothetical protein
MFRAVCKSIDCDGRVGVNLRDVGHFFDVVDVDYGKAIDACFGNVYVIDFDVVFLISTYLSSFHFSFFYRDYEIEIAMSLGWSNLLMS